MLLKAFILGGIYLPIGQLLMDLTPYNITPGISGRLCG
jgi:hypothetical protein